MPVSWQRRCKPPAAPTARRAPATVLKTRRFQASSARRLPASRALPITMMPMATTSSTSGRPTPITISRAVPPPSGSLGMSPSDWKIRSASGTAVATTSTAAAQPLAFGVVGTFCIGACGAASATASQRDQAAPRPATRIASGTPNSATRLQGASRMEAAAIGTGEMSASPWLAEIASASAAGAAPRFFGSAPPVTARRSGVSSANAVEGEAASPATSPHSAGRRVAPAQRHEANLSGEPAGGAGCLRKPGDKACGDNHQSGRSDRLRKARAEGFADKGGGEAGREPEGGGDHDDRQKRVQQPRLGQRNQGDKGGKEQKRLDERHAGHCGGVTLAFALRAQGFPGIHWRRSF